jgi:cytochrome c oxidase cbb3-type subunit III
MFSRSWLKKKIFILLILSVCILHATAQDAAKASANNSSAGMNQLAFLLAVVAIVLAFVIWGLGNILVQLSRQVLHKQQEEKKSGTIAAPVLIGMLLISNIGFAQGNPAVQGTTAPNYGGLSAEGFWIFIGVIGMEVIAILFLLVMIRRIQAELLPQKEKIKTSSGPSWWAGLDKKLFTRAVPVEKEADVMLDHDYDGIRELDNALPPWWKYGFYITILIAIIYLFNFHVLGSGKNPLEEYNAEIENARIQQEIFDSKNKDKIDEKNVPLADAAGIKAGQQMFEANCSPCHLKGSGSQDPPSVGPNLTDDYWLHKGSLNDIYATIKNGYPDKGMQSWSTKFNPKEISQLAGFIKSLKGTKEPNAKLPQGEIYMEESKPVADTAAKKNSITVNLNIKKDTIAGKTQ